MQPLRKKDPFFLVLLRSNWHSSLYKFKVQSGTALPTSWSDGRGRCSQHPSSHRCSREEQLLVARALGVRGLDALRQPCRVLRRRRLAARRSPDRKSFADKSDVQCWAENSMLKNSIFLFLFSEAICTYQHTRMCGGGRVCTKNQNHHVREASEGVKEIRDFSPSFACYRKVVNIFKNRCATSPRGAW